MGKSLNSRPVPFPRGVAAVDEGLGWTEHAGTFDLFWMNETLVCVTHGRGMFQIDLSAA